MNKRYYWLRHKYKLPTWTAEEIKSIGFFSSTEDAENAIEELKNQVGFVKYPEGFQIIELKIDEIAWDILRDSIFPRDLPSEMEK
jgi:hypothetical protein